MKTSVMDSKVRVPDELEAHSVLFPCSMSAPHHSSNREDLYQETTARDSIPPLSIQMDL